MKDNSGKVILALLAGASAGIVAGLLMAPEAGSETRGSLGKSLGKLGEDLNKLLQDGLAKVDALKGGTTAGDEADRSGAEDALAGISSDKSSKKSSAGASTAGSTGSTASRSSSAGGSASTASSSRNDGGVGSSGGPDAGGTTGGSGVGS
jgi:gas vesicle protein